MPRKQTVTVSLTAEQLQWLDEQEESRSELVREALISEYGINQDDV